MLSKCKYMNGDSLERHNWGNNPIKLNHIPKNLNLPSFEEDLLNSLNLEDNEKSIVELLWGDIQLGKRVQACIIMWISVYILKRPVLYIFRNLTIDQKQMQDDIIGTENYNFNIQFIKSIFEEFNSELQDYFDESNVEYWKDYKLPELKDVNANDVMNKLSNKEAMNSNDIFCCLMNHTRLAKVNEKFSEYIYYNDELVNITTLVDESDLMSPTSSNDRSNDNDKRDSTACEILLAKIYKKVKYVLHITGTAHSLLYNVTTRLSDQTDIQIKISKVHKMKRTSDYFGLFNNSITFNSSLVESWWDYQDNNKKHYNIVEDYNVNIKRIIEEILTRPASVKYNSLLISEEKIRTSQFSLVDKIINDFPNLFIVIYHGNCLRLYISKHYETEIKHWSEWDSKQSSSGQRLWQFGGVYDTSIDTDKSVPLPNHYCYFDINTDILNIKFVYKLLRILFEHSNIPILHKTIITITGKYGERGYSFTSDDYDNYSLHLTDQYFVSHASLNCTDISQRLRLQGKYNDLELQNGTMKLTLWTTTRLRDVIENFYVTFIKEIEKYIMCCATWEEIKELLESIIDLGNFKFGKYIKYIDASKKLKNLKQYKCYDRKKRGYKLMFIDDTSDEEIKKLCDKLKFGDDKLADYICINEIKDDLTVEEFTEKYGEYKPLVPMVIQKECINLNDKESTLAYLRTFNPKCKSYAVRDPNSENTNRKKGINQCILENKPYNYGRSKPNECAILNYADESYYHLVGLTDEKRLPPHTDDYINKVPYMVAGDKVKYSVIKDKYKPKPQNESNAGYVNECGDDFIEDADVLPDKYYWKTPDGWLYYYDKNKPEMCMLEILSPQNVDVAPPVVQMEPSIDCNVMRFASQCCKQTDKPNLRFGLKDVYKTYELWCKINGKKCLKTQKKFKEEFAKLNYKEESSKGVDINGIPGKRGYNIMVSL